MHPDHLCVLSARCHSCYPIDLVEDEAAAERVASDMAKETSSTKGFAMAEDEVRHIIYDALFLMDPGLSYYPHEWHPLGYRDYSPEKEIEKFPDRCIVFKKTKDGSVDMTVVACYDPEQGGWLAEVMEVNGNEELVEGWAEVGAQYGDPFFCWRRPFLYLREWAQIGGNVYFIRWFFNVVNANRGPPTSWPAGFFASGILPCIDYGGLEKTYDNGMTTDLEAARSGSRRTADAIATGRRGKELWHALAFDFGAWMLVRPDIWPAPYSTGLPNAVRFRVMEHSPSFFGELPDELIVAILRHSSVSDVLAMCLVSRSIYRLIMAVIDDVFSCFIYAGELRRILPVASVPVK